MPKLIFTFLNTPPTKICSKNDKAKYHECNVLILTKNLALNFFFISSYKWWSGWFKDCFERNEISQKWHRKVFVFAANK